MSSRSNCQYCDYGFTSYRKKPEEKRKEYHNERSCKRECDRSRSRSHSEERSRKCNKYYSNKHYDSSCSEKESKSDDSVSSRSRRSECASHRSEPTSHRSKPTSPSKNTCEKYKVCEYSEEKDKKCTKKIEGKCGNVIYITIRC